MLDSTGSGTADFGVIAANAGKIFTFNGSSWSETDIGSTDFFGAAAINSQDAWVVGAGGVAYHWDGSSWTSISTDTSQALNGVTFIAPKKNPASAWQQIFH